MSPLSCCCTRLRDSSSIVMADTGSFVRVMRCTTDIKPVLLSWGSRCCACASNFPSNLFLSPSLGGTCTYRRLRWWENGAVAAANKRIRQKLLRWLQALISPSLIYPLTHSRNSFHICVLLPVAFHSKKKSPRHCGESMLNWLECAADASRRRHAEEQRRWFCTI